MITPDLTPLIENLKASRGKNWQHQRFFLRQLLRLVAQGTPVAPDTIVETLGLETEIVRAQQEALRIYRCEFNTQGLVGAIFTQTPTPHRVWLAGRTLFLLALLLN